MPLACSPGFSLDWALTGVSRYGIVDLEQGCASADSLQPTQRQRDVRYNLQWRLRKRRDRP